MWKVEPPIVPGSEDTSGTHCGGSSLKEDVHTVAKATRDRSDMDRPKVMVVDDDEDLLSLMRRSLEKGGFNVIARSSPPDQHELGRIAPSVLFMDVDLADANGAAICDSIKKDERIAHLPVILISAQEEGRLKSTATNCHADGFLTKPFKKGVMIEVAWSYADLQRRVHPGISPS